MVLVLCSSSGDALYLYEILYYCNTITIAKSTTAVLLLLEKKVKENSGSSYCNTIVTTIKNTICLKNKYFHKALVLMTSI